MFDFIGLVHNSFSETLLVAICACFFFFLSNMLLAANYVWLPSNKCVTSRCPCFRCRMRNLPQAPETAPNVAQIFHRHWQRLGMWLTVCHTLVGRLHVQAPDSNYGHMKGTHILPSPDDFFDFFDCLVN